ncbi:Alpha/Beta hydrolase protein [Nemania diffusa]|nr:Alpha/Beta hydrolase protein [Nemania diffusa]
MKVNTKPYGQWESPITARALSYNSVSLNAPRSSCDGKALYYLEADCNGHGRIKSTNRPSCTIPDNFSVGNDLYSYGGGAYVVDADGFLVFFDSITRCVYCAGPGGHTVHFFPHPQDARIILTVREVKSLEISRSKVSIVYINTTDCTETQLVQGSDFYSHPRFNHDGTMLCARLLVAPWSSGIGPHWGLDRRLFYCHDDTGYQQLYHLIRLNGLEERELAGAEFLLSSNTYFHLDGSYLIVAYIEAARSQLALVDYVRGTYVDLDRINSREFLAIGATSSSAPALYQICLPEVLEGIEKKISCYTTKIVQSFDTSEIPEGMLSTPTPLTFPRSYETQVSNERCLPSLGVGHAFIMRPTNANYTAPAGERPTKHHRPSINLEAQYFTSRGYMVALLNHAGSTGYGRAYRDAMDGGWGVVDVQDAVDLVQALIQDGLVDAKRVGITGPSAGGYLTLQAICTRAEVWAGAVSVFGISDMSSFAATTHHFEAYYDYLLIRGRDSLDQVATDTEQGAEEARRKLYGSRSPVTRARDSKVPVLLLQGSEDCVVTPDQATAYVEAANQGFDESGHTRKALESRVELVMYKHEGHGFHLASTKKDSLERTEKWWRKTLV